MKRPGFAITEASATGAVFAAAALTALATLAIGAAVLLGGARLRIENAGRLVTVAVIADDPGQQAARARSILAMLRARDDLRAPHIVPEKELRSEIGDGPLPALIDATLIPGATEAPLARALADLPGVSVVRAETPATTGLRTLLRIAGLIAATAVAGSLATGIAIVRERLSTLGQTLGVLERLGASDAQMARWIAAPALHSLLIGGLIGWAATIPFIAWQAGAIEGGAMPSIPRGSWALLAAAPIGTILSGVLGALAAGWRGLRGRS
jgi:hypothetical protein